MKNQDLILARVRALITRGASLYYWDGQPSVPLQAIEWIPGKGLLFAVQGAQDQSGVHLLEADEFTNEGSTVIEDSTEFDLLTPGGDLIASIYPTAAADAPGDLPESWGRFWAQEVENAKGGE